MEPEGSHKHDIIYITCVRVKNSRPLMITSNG